jgi:hypothetical protein
MTTHPRTGDKGLMTLDQQFSRMSDEELLKEVNLAQKARNLSEDAVLWRSALLKEKERRGL